MLADPIDDIHESQNLLLICKNEAEARSMSSSLRALQPIETRAVDARNLLQPAPSGVLLVKGLPLDENGTFRRLRAVLKPFLDRQVPVLWLLDTPSVRDEVQARALGADVTLPRTSSASLVRSAVNDLPGRAARQRMHRKAIQQSILRDVDTRLDGLLTTAAGGDETGALLVEASRLMRTAAAAPELEFWLTAMSIAHDPTYRHSLLMAGITAALTTSLGLRREHCAALVRAALLHDIGKTLVPVEILDKPGQLAPTEMAALHEHPQFGFEMLQAQGDHDLTMLSVVRHHHESLDGSGYPLELRGSQVNETVRIATICDIFTALIEERAYKPSYSATKAFETMMALHNRLDLELLTRLRRLLVSK